MSGRRSRKLRRMAATLVACSTIGTPIALAQLPASSARTTAKNDAAQLPLRRYDIAAGTLATALCEYERLSGVEVSVRFDRVVLEALHSPGISGLYSDPEALAALLEGSGVEHRFSGRRRASLTLPVHSESIDVAAAGPEIASPKFTQPLVDTPRTVAVIPDEVFLAQGATTLRDVLRNTPGITFQAGEGGGGVPGDSFSMRGFSGGNDILLDGVRESGAYGRDAFNLEQVEVIKGPSGAFAGRGAAGGAVNLVTKSPKPETFTRATFAAGNAGLTRITADANAPLESLLGAAIRITGMTASSGVPGREIVHNSSWGIAPSLAFGIGTPSRFTLALQHVEQDNVPDYGLPWAALDAAPSVDQSNFYGLSGYDYEDIRSDVATATFEHDLRDGWTLRSIARWNDNHRDSAITAPRPPNRQLQQRLMDQGQLTAQTSLSGSVTTGSLRHAFSAGLEAGRETALIRRQAQTTNQPQTSLEHPDPRQLPLGPMPVNAGNPEETQMDVAALYAFDTVEIGNSWEVTGGLRWDSVQTDYELTNAASGAKTALGRDDSMVSWNAGIVFKPRPDASIYASHAIAFSPSVDASASGPGLSDSPTSANNVNLAPEKTKSLEVGAKWELAGHRAIASAALFRTEKTNARTRSATTEPYVLDGEQRVNGVELGITGQLTPAWSVLASYSHLDSEIVASANPLEQGSAMALVPENSFNVWTDVRFLRRFSAGGGVQYMDSVYRNATNTAEVPEYWLLSATAAMEVNRKLTLRLNANNLADAEYVDRVGGGHYIPGAGRSVTISAEVGF